MAQKIIVQLESDLSGKTIEQGEGSTVYFAFQGKSFEIDLSDTELAEFESVLDPYLKNGRRAKTRSGSAPVASTPSGSGMSKEELTKIREWAKSEGMDIAPRGRLKQSLIDSYNAAQGK